MHKSISAIFTGVALCGLTISHAHAASKSLPMTLRTQEQDCWCWAASAQMIMEYRGRHFLEQCEVAQMTFGPDSSPKCCLEPVPASGTKCNRPLSVDDIHYTLDPVNIGTSEMIVAPIFGFDPATGYNTMKSWINANNPFIIFWGWNGGGGHYIVGAGYADASGSLKNRVVVLNPWPGEGIKTLDYNAVLSPSGGSMQYIYSTGAAATSNDKVTIYKDSGRRGTSLTTASTTYVGDSMNDQTSSANVKGVPYVFYQDSNYNGTSWSANPGAYGSAGSWNGPDNAVSSVKSMPNADQLLAVVLFENENYGGASRFVSYFDINSSNMNLHNIGWGDRVSSLIVVSGLWQMFQDANFGGLPYGVTSFGGPNRDGFYPNPASWGGPNDDISSLRVVTVSEDPVILYSDSDLSGRAVILTPSSNPSWFNDFRTFNFDDTVSSIKTYGDTWTVYNDPNQTGISHQLGSNRWMRNWSAWGGNNDEITSISFTGTGNWF